MNQKKFYYLLLLVFIIFFVWSFSPQKSEAEDFSEKVKITLRQIGNQLLLSNQDSTSIILPITKITENKFRISFEKKLSFEPNILVEIVKTNLEKTSLSKNYRVEVLQCSDNEVGYSYEINAIKAKTIIPCIGRVLPIKCYLIEIQFLDKRVTKSKGIFLFYIIIPITIGLIYRKYFQNKTEKKSLENQTIIGSFIFYPEQNKLMQKTKEIALSKKECELLEILVENKNIVVKREELTKKVWEDNGVFVGRSLDTHISKLRKKLQQDKDIKLTNIHGVGYKLQIIK